MLENRSYDNILGWLYKPDNPAPYNQAPAGQAGLNGLTGNESNPSSNGESIPISNASTTTTPIHDPGEDFCDMAQQIFGFESPAKQNPWNGPVLGGMSGFVKNYATQLDVFDHGHLPDCITYFTPEQLPVTSFLASNFAVADQWYAAVPCQTYTNRSFSISAGPPVCIKNDLHPSRVPYSLVNDSAYIEANPWLGNLQPLPCVFQALDETFPNDEPNWKVYFHDYSISMQVSPYVYEAAKSSSNKNVATFDYSDYPEGETPSFFEIFKLGGRTTTFMEDLENGKLPKLSFIEPRYSNDVGTITGNPPNSNHPGSAELLHTPLSRHIDVYDGETFLAQLYNAIRQSPMWDRCLLIITYDEHGGMYDHVTPAPATPPGRGIPDGYDPHDSSIDGFKFNYFGCRIPTIVVSPHIESGSTLTPPDGVPFDHTSIIKTVWDQFITPKSKLQPAVTSLTDRDASAPSLLPFLTSKNATGLAVVPDQIDRRMPGPTLVRKTLEQHQALMKARLLKSIHLKKSSI